MKNTILILTSIGSFSAEEIINKINEIPEEEDIQVYLNSPGGSVYSAWAILFALMSRTGSYDVKVIGQASSMAPMFLVGARKREGIDVSGYTLHRATSYYEGMDENVRAEVMKVSKDMMGKLSAIINDDELFAIKGVRLKDIFEAKEQTDYFLNAKEAKRIGLIQKVIKLERTEAEAISSHITASMIGEITAETHKPATTNKPENNKINTMTLAELKEKHPELYAQVIAAGAEAERDRVGAWMAFADIDIKAVSEGINGGKNISAKEMAEFSRKALSAEQLKLIQKNSPGATKTDESDGATEKQKQLDAFAKEAETKRKGGKL